MLNAPVAKLADAIASKAVRPPRLFKALGNADQESDLLVGSTPTRSTKFYPPMNKSYLAPVAELADAADLKSVFLFVGSTPTRSTTGVWRSLVAQRLWEPKVVGSNPITPIA
jgi:hypothetical protein